MENRKRNLEILRQLCEEGKEPEAAEFVKSLICAELPNCTSYEETANALGEIEQLMQEARDTCSSNPPAKIESIQRVSEIITLAMIREKANLAQADEELLNVLIELEALLPSFGAAPDVIWFRITPPILKSPKYWLSLAGDLPIPVGSLKKLLASDFTPPGIVLLDKVLAASLPSNPFSFIESPGDYLLIDTEYGIAFNGKTSNLSINPGMVERYKKMYEQIERTPSLYFSIGALRGWQAAQAAHEIVRKTRGGLKNFTASTSMTRMINLLADTVEQQFKDFPQALELEISTREELDALTDLLRRYAKGDGEKNLELWFRGQKSDYLLQDLSAEAANGFCPWRQIRDSSLTPSLYRDPLQKIFKEDQYNPREYINICLELAIYGSFVKGDLDIPELLSQGNQGMPTKEAWSSAALWESKRKLADIPGSEEILTFDLLFRDIQRAFFLQHYGLPSSILDITHDIDVALFFAQNQLADNRYIPVNFQACDPLIYVFILDRRVDPFLNSETLSQHYGLLRPQRQKCGLLTGASILNRNDYARFISLKIRLAQPIRTSGQPSHYYFPPPEEDQFLARLLSFAITQGLTRLHPMNPLTA